MKKPSEMPREIDLYFFREGEVPMWEVSLTHLASKPELTIGESKWGDLDHQDQEGRQRQQDVGESPSGPHQRTVRGAKGHRDGPLPQDQGEAARGLDQGRPQREGEDLSLEQAETDPQPRP